MHLIHQIYRVPGLPTEGKKLVREAARAIILDETQLFMVYSRQNGDYKFPGGGIKQSETPQQALVREVREECGATVSHVEKPFGRIVEYNAAREPEYDIFQMTSYYYICRITDRLDAARLDPYEAELGFTAVWVPIADALQQNESVSQHNGPDVPPWVDRETFVLRLIQTRLAANGTL